jgi:hypothetical protein
LVLGRRRSDTRPLAGVNILRDSIIEREAVHTQEFY